MKEHPILFSAPMVRAILEGRKTQTRRVVKPGKLYGIIKNNPEDIADCSNFSVHPPSIDAPTGFYFDLGDNVKIMHCPYGRPGDRLWVRETWFQKGYWHNIQVPEGVFEGDVEWRGEKHAAYATDGDPGEGWRKRPSIHMPRWASRITLEIVSVRVERLQQISEHDAIAEGIEVARIVSNGKLQPNTYRDYTLRNDDPFEWFSSPRASYLTLWESINGPDSWNANQWVWVIEFKNV